MRAKLIPWLVLAAWSGTALAQDPERGGRLYENHCTACHDSVAHQRPTRKADSWQSLLVWVERWRAHLELDWNAADRADVAAYLDDRFYRFPSR